MIGQRTLVRTVTARAVAGLATAVAIAVLAPMAPLAVADPASDADAAITAAWQASGAAAGGLGIKTGGVYPAGNGFGQDFAGGRVYFSPQTGAHAMQGAILEKYLALGGPSDGDLGLPTIDEGAGRAPGSRNTTFGAADNPVIFWTPDTGAYVVRGAINAAWDKLGGSNAVLGVPTSDETYRGDLVSQDFTGGQVTWDRKSRAFTTTPAELADQLAGLTIPGDATTAINAARRAAGGAMGPLGAPSGNQYEIGADGAGQKYAGGKIFYSPATGASVLTGQVLAKYESVGGPEGDLGLPAGTEGDGGLRPSSTIVGFAADDEPVIFWTPDFGAFIVRGAMNAAWTKLGGATGQLGAPTADQTENGTVVTQKFNGGAISYDESTKTFTTEPANLSAQLRGLPVPTRQKPQAQAPRMGSNSAVTWYREHQRLLLIIGAVALVLAILVVIPMVSRRRRARRPSSGAADGAASAADDGFGEDDDFGDFSHVSRVSDDGDAAVHDHVSGPLPVSRPVAKEDDPRYAPVSMWAMPPEQPGAPIPGLHGPSDDEEAVTAPTRIDADTARIPADPPGDAAGHDEHQREGAGYGGDPVDHADEPASGPPSGRHAAIQLDAAEPTQTSLRLAAGDPYRAPAGYPVKADTATGLYYAPGSGRYDHAKAEIWFASEEFALTNGFVRG